MRWSTLILIAFVLSAMPQLASAQRGNRSQGATSNANQRTEILRLSKDLDRLQRDLLKELMGSEAMTAAQSDFKAAALEMKSARQIVNEQMLADTELQQMKLQLFTLQVQMNELRNAGSGAVGTRPLAQEMLDLRTRIRTIEVGIQESVDAFVDARDRLQVAQQDLNDARRDVLDQLKNDPTLAAARERIRSARAAISGAHRR